MYKSDGRQSLACPI